jgi:hypothetical protein
MPIVGSVLVACDPQFERASGCVLDFQDVCARHWLGHLQRLIGYAFLLLCWRGAFCLSRIRRRCIIVSNGITLIVGASWDVLKAFPGICIISNFAALFV